MAGVVVEHNAAGPRSRRSHSFDARSLEVEDCGWEDTCDDDEGGDDAGAVGHTDMREHGWKPSIVT